MDTVQTTSMEKQQLDIDKEEQFKGWVQDYSDMLFSHAVLRGFDHSSARDMVQETFFSAWKNMDGFEGRASVKNWLFVILKNKITDHFRRMSAHAQTMISEYDDAFDNEGHWAKASYPKALIVNPDDGGENSEFQRILDGCSGKLNRIQKAVFLMKYVDELESDDICLQLSLSANNYWTILHRAKVQLRACIEKNWLQTK